MTKLELIELIIIVAIAFVMVLWLLIKAIKNKWISSIIETVNISIKQAESNALCKTGQEKKNYVLACVESKCEELHIPYYILSKLISKLVDTIIKHYNVISK